LLSFLLLLVFLMFLSLLLSLLILACLQILASLLLGVFEMEFRSLSLPRNSSERNSMRFLVCETDGIPMENITISMYSVFRGFFFFSENGAPKKCEFAKAE
jgi:hypothetical protein